MNEHKKALKFLFYALGLYLGWFILQDLWLKNVEHKLTTVVAEASVNMLNFIGYNSKSYLQVGSNESIVSMIQIDGADVVLINPACNGMVLMALFVGFVFAFPGPISIKALFVPVGLVIINVLNVLRITALALNSHYYYETISFNHKYTFTIIVYAAVFALWMLWIKKFSGVYGHVPKATTTTH